jgi:hypothetical protein
VGTIDYELVSDWLCNFVFDEMGKKIRLEQVSTNLQCLTSLQLEFHVHMAP